jgi:hypothetical protein
MNDPGDNEKEFAVDYDKWTDVTDRATDLGWTLPEGWSVKATTVAEQPIRDPRDWGDVYATDIDEDDYTVRTRGFCARCGAWIRKLDADSIVGMGPDSEGRHPEPGDWATLATGVACDDREYHELGVPMTVLTWCEDKWRFVTVLVHVLDDAGNERGSDVLGMVEEGEYPVEIDRETGAVTTKKIDPVTDPDHPLPDMIPTALHDARDRVAWVPSLHAALVPPVVAPEGTSSS